jgi:vancomycin aglycone glucosyltransferase
MKVALVICGSRGDVQPMVALALGLQSLGHEAHVYAPREHEDWAASYGCPFTPLGMGIRGNPDLANAGYRSLMRFVRQETLVQMDALPKALDGSGLVLSTGFAFGVPTAAELLGIPYRFVAFSPATTRGTNRDSVAARAAGWLLNKVINASHLDTINRRRQELGLPPVRSVLAHCMGDRVIAATDPALTYIREGTTLKAAQTGYMHLPTRGALSDEIVRFVESGAPPVYVGFGSMPVGDPVKTVGVLVEAGRAAGQRLIISKGWGGLQETTRHSDCLFVDDVPHELLFPRVAAVVHHGGAGTVATAARAAVPQILMPYMADQFQWRTQVVKLGLGPKASMFRMLSAKGLSRAITECLSNVRYRARAEAVARSLQGTDGVALTLKALAEDLR